MVLFLSLWSRDEFVWSFQLQSLSVNRSIYKTHLGLRNEWAYVKFVHLYAQKRTQAYALTPWRQNPRFVPAFTTARHRSLSWANWIHSTPPPPACQFPQDPFWFHPSTYASVFQVVSFLRTFLPKPCTVLSPPPMRHTCPAHLILLDFICDVFSTVLQRNHLETEEVDQSGPRNAPVEATLRHPNRVIRKRTAADPFSKWCCVGRSEGWEKWIEYCYDMSCSVGMVMHRPELKRVTWTTLQQWHVTQHSMRIIQPHCTRPGAVTQMPHSACWVSLA
jgi:hypothetical protein